MSVCSKCDRAGAINEDDHETSEHRTIREPQHPFDEREHYDSTIATEAEPKGCPPHQLINCSECRKDALIKSQCDEIERLRAALALISTGATQTCEGKADWNMTNVYRVAEAALGGTLDVR